VPYYLYRAKGGAMRKLGLVGITLLSALLLSVLTVTTAVAQDEVANFVGDTASGSNVANIEQILEPLDADPILTEDEGGFICIITTVFPEPVTVCFTLPDVEIFT
jgi:hypothetical protein